MVEDVIYNIKKYQSLRETLVDERSRSIMDELLKFRMTMDIEHTRRAYSLSIERGVQYFDIDIMKFEESGIYIDGGAYKGETTKALICELQKQRKQYYHIYVIEPDSNLIKEAHKQLAAYKNIAYCSIGLSSRSELLKFNYTGDTWGAFDSNGQIEIELDTIDHITNCNANYIKLDIEGFEEKALAGAVNTIMNCKPKMAISVYHKNGDIWRIFDAVNKIRTDYKVICVIILRHILTQLCILYRNYLISKLQTFERSP